ncbi:MAG: enoyl-CoA hydratase/isomerase family protein [Hyphomicrobiales bacterium]|nr:enoyl-CoA hydratase/isomerase family protein [Hyphomicrobiales bacterium]MCP5373656.1 enoyl-CoA hydratase/isomerase family protein [Hyphomicrobiales bacterium]
MSETLRVERDGAIAHIVLNRPQAMNALNQAMAEDLRDATAALAADDTVRCVVLRGEGGNFQAGGDVLYFRDGLDDPQMRRRESFEAIIGVVHDAIDNIRDMRKPVIASANGAIAGFGVSLLAACDLAVIADDCVLTVAYCLIGTSPDGGSTHFLPRMVGMKRAMELILLGDRFDAATALDYGLANKMVPADQVAAVTAKLAARLAAGPTHAYGNAKMLLNATFETDRATQLHREMESFADCALTADFAEGVRAFCDKRKADFTGK